MREREKKIPFVQKAELCDDKNMKIEIKCSNRTSLCCPGSGDIREILPSREKTKWTAGKLRSKRIGKR